MKILIKLIQHHYVIYYVVWYLLFLPESHTLCFLDSHTHFYLCCTSVRLGKAFYEGCLRSTRCIQNMYLDFCSFHLPCRYKMLHLNMCLQTLNGNKIMTTGCIKHSGHLRTREKFRKHELQVMTRFYISYFPGVFYDSDT